MVIAGLILTIWGFACLIEKAGGVLLCPWSSDKCEVISSALFGLGLWAKSKHLLVLIAVSPSSQDIHKRSLRVLRCNRLRARKCLISCAIFSRVVWFTAYRVINIARSRNSYRICIIPLIAHFALCLEAFPAREHPPVMLVFHHGNYRWWVIICCCYRYK
jgi:hypothetical protein